MSQWKDICKIDDILPETGVCALLGDEQVAIFRPYHSDQVFAISNIDPFFESSVLSRGLIAEHQGAVIAVGGVYTRPERGGSAEDLHMRQFGGQVVQDRHDLGTVLNTHMHVGAK